MIKIKRILLISVILVVVIFLNVSSIFYLKDVTENTIKSLNSVTTKDEIRAVLDDWDKNKKRIGLFVHDDRVNEITDSLESCYSTFGSERFTSELEKTCLSLTEIYEKQLPTFYNVF